MPHLFHAVEGRIEIGLNEYDLRALMRITEYAAILAHNSPEELAYFDLPLPGSDASPAWAQHCELWRTCFEGLIVALVASRVESVSVQHILFPKTPPLP